MQRTSLRFRFTYFMATAVCGLCLFAGGIVPAAHAQTQTVVITTSKSSFDMYLSLEAELKFLQAIVDQLKAGGTTSVAPTFATGMSGNTVKITGNITRADDAKGLETCGPLQKGTVDWGDGTTSKLMGLGCSGNIFTFSRSHAYSESGSYHVKVTDQAGRSLTRVVASVRQ